MKNSDRSDGKSSDRPSDPVDAGGDEPSPGLLADFRDFLIHNKLWWILPILIVLVLIVLVAVVIWMTTPDSSAPFMYPTF